MLNNSCSAVTHAGTNLKLFFLRFPLTYFIFHIKKFYMSGEKSRKRASPSTSVATATAAAAAVNSEKVTVVKNSESNDSLQVVGSDSTGKI